LPDDGDEAFPVLFKGEVEGACGGVGGHLGEEFAVAGEEFEFFGDGLRVTNGDDEAVDAVADDAARVGRGDDRETSGASKAPTSRSRRSRVANLATARKRYGMPF
jgi:hypothetical protein